ncbi:MAG: bifunctional 4-hydroxy-2-oxoglutarate aldolase/2-dehydro-3-deoxy-phosphogluconate aldolase [Melioribacteraceae bacterium]|nr:bifunctional 4-hydroxy-2-oxoglutarate aldolase/2-dehydro-3-deoxy-phosphogluconate aldolase [Melioribacteraceae bacterium]MCF8265142.1 bifunctional 4-hydroxy-2-oxoglutarate aldolase/2-dehydro-3-deoxy-phosphogluconate aldolase [Melioribacteraceae bacterium]
MSKNLIIESILLNGSVAVIRTQDVGKLMKVAEALYNGGVKSLEITMTVPNAIEVINEISKKVKDDILIGVGTVLDSETTRKSIEAGAKFVVSPILKKEIIDTAHNYDVPVFPGAFSPTEIQTAHEWGADIVKVFPADILGMKYFKNLNAPLPHIKMMPTGGVTPENAGDWIRNGACAVGIGSALLDEQAILDGDYKLLERKAKVLTESIKNAKN